MTDWKARARAAEAQRDHYRSGVREHVEWLEKAAQRFNGMADDADNNRDFWRGNAAAYESAQSHVQPLLDSEPGLPEGQGEALIDRVLERFRPTAAHFEMGDGHTQAVNWREVVGQIIHYAGPIQVEPEGATPDEAAAEFIRRAELLEGLTGPDNAGAVAYREAAEFLATPTQQHCENCGGTEIERRQGPGEWIEEPCPDCTGKEVGVGAGESEPAEKVGTRTSGEVPAASVDSNLDPVEQFKRLRDELLGEAAARVFAARLEQYGWLRIGLDTEREDRLVADLRRAMASVWNFATGHAPLPLPADSNLDQGGKHGPVDDQLVAGAAVDVGGGPENSLIALVAGCLAREAGWTGGLREAQEEDDDGNGTIADYFRRRAAEHLAKAGETRCPADDRCETPNDRPESRTASPSSSPATPRSGSSPSCSPTCCCSTDRQPVEDVIEELEGKESATRELRDLARKNGDGTGAAVHGEARAAYADALQLLHKGHSDSGEKR